MLPTILALSNAPSNSAVEVLPTSYSGRNGYTGTYQYWDDKYVGGGGDTVCCNGQNISGGVGDLTDGVIATESWSVVEPPDGPGPYVGWSRDPILTFFFRHPVDLISVTLHLDDSNGNGGVSAPSAARIKLNSDIPFTGPYMDFPIADPAGSAPFSFTIPIGATVTSVTVRLTPRTQWVFMSEVDFEATAAPVPDAASTLGLLSMGLAGLAALRRRA